MAKTYQGRVSGRYKAPTSPKLDEDAPTIVVKVDGATMPKVGDRVELRVLLPDEEVGRRLREMLTVDVDKRSVRDLATNIEDSDGWPILADLIRDVIDA